jgi:hypothetical protein
MAQGAGLSEYCARTREPLPPCAPCGGSGATLIEACGEVAEAPCSECAGTGERELSDAEARLHWIRHRLASLYGDDAAQLDVCALVEALRADMLQLRALL